MAEYVLDAEPRQITGKKVKNLRNAGLIPIVVYGAKTATHHLQVQRRALEVALAKVGGTALINITVGGEPHIVLAREVQRDVMRGNILHVDFLEIEAGVAIRAEIPLSFVGESPAVEARLGILITGPAFLHVEVLPSQLMSHIAVDLSVLKAVGDAIHVSDLNLGEGVIIHNDPEEMIARINQSSADRAEEDEAAEEAAASAEPEVIGRGKEDEDEDEE